MMAGVKKRKIRGAIYLLLVMLYCSGSPTQAQYGGGTGEPNDPYQIATAEHLNAIGTEPNDWDKHFKLMADIDLSGITYSTAIIPEFTGVFDGNGHKISNFTYSSIDTDCIGLFGHVVGGAEIKDLGLIDTNIHAETGDNVGSLVGYLEDGTITGCYVEGGIVSGNRHVGGIVGAHGRPEAGPPDWTIFNCYSTSSVQGTMRVGGLVGSNYEGKITKCYATGSVSGTVRNVGGLVGWNDSESTISDCYSTGSVSGGDKVGGLLGCNEWLGDVICCYSIGPVSGGSYVGGLLGSNNGYVTNCYSTGVVSGSHHVGGLVGYKRSYGNLINSFWDMETSEQETSAIGKGKTTIEMQTASTFIAWGYEPVWTIDEGKDYPRLLWENKPGETLSERLSDFVTGSGAPNEPYLIYTAEQLNMIGLFWCEWDKHFKLMVDIDLAAYTGTQFNTIGIKYRLPFNGVFDGNGKRISNFTYTSTDADGIGLFAYVRGGDIKDLGLIDPNVDAGPGNEVGSLVGHLSEGAITNCYAEGGSVSGMDCVGGLVGCNYRYNSKGTITDCFVSASVSGDRNIGGLVGYNCDGTISNCYSGGSVSGNEWVGGLVGRNGTWDGGTITNCYAISSVLGDESVGGLVGYNYDGTISNCYSAGSVSGSGTVWWHGGVGGLVGWNKGIVSNCYAISSVLGDESVGGLVGSNSHGTITNCYSAGRVTCSGVDPVVGNVGGLIGAPVVITVFDSFWDIQISVQTSSVGGTGKTTAEMKLEITFTDAGWDFVDETANGTEDIWWILEGQDYPRLWWELSD